MLQSDQGDAFEQRAREIVGSADMRLVGISRLYYAFGGAAGLVALGFLADSLGPGMGLIVAAAGFVVVGCLLSGLSWLLTLRAVRRELGEVLARSGESRVALERLLNARGPSTRWWRAALRTV